jgi:hypothetical protein
MPPKAFAAVTKRSGISLTVVDSIRSQFGTSFAATLYRLATAAAIPVAAGLFCYRSTRSEDFKARQGTLFPGSCPHTSQPKYRRQSFHHSASYPRHLIFPWNKSLPFESIVYSAARKGGMCFGSETLEPKGGVRATFRVEAVPAPYQRTDGHTEWPDVLALLIVLP